jgi:hypothetical protein
MLDHLARAVLPIAVAGHPGRTPPGPDRLGMAISQRDSRRHPIGCRVDPSTRQGSSRGSRSPIATLPVIRLVRGWTRATAQPSATQTAPDAAATARSSWSPPCRSPERLGSVILASTGRVRGRAGPTRRRGLHVLRTPRRRRNRTLCHSTLTDPFQHRVTTFDEHSGAAWSTHLLGEQPEICAVRSGVSAGSARLFLTESGGVSHGPGRILGGWHSKWS